MTQKTLIEECICQLPVAEDYIHNPEEYIRTFDVNINGKVRHLVTYQATSKGYSLRKLHRYFSEYIRKKYRQSKKSFAYAKGKCFQDCVNQHLTNSVFLKTDIHSYFGSIGYDCMLKRILQLNIPQEMQKNITILTKACFYNGSLPLGYVSSPILSDFFLVLLDRKYAARKNITYTRYADDFIISSNAPDAEQHLAKIQSDLKKDLALLDLELNFKKTYIRRLTSPGDAIHVLGVNIVKTDYEENRVTVSDRYIRKTCRSLCALLCDHADTPDKETLLACVSGQIDFIHQCSDCSFLKFAKMVYIKSGFRGGYDARSLRKACGLSK